MKILPVLALTLVFMTSVSGQMQSTLIADGTLDMPVKQDSQPAVEKLSAAETQAVRQADLAAEVEFVSEREAMSSEESVFKKDFELLDAADVFFIYREIRFRAYLYTAYSSKMRRNYQGIMVLRALENRPRFETAAHYVYGYRGDRYLRALPDINGNVLSELAVFSEPPTKKEFKRFVRVIEFSPGGLEKFGTRELYRKGPQPTTSTPEKKDAKRVYVPARIEAIRLYADKEFGKPLEFYEERRLNQKAFWGMMDKLQRRPATLDEDQTVYVELYKPVFPKGNKNRSSEILN